MEGVGGEVVEGSRVVLAKNKLILICTKFKQTIKWYVICQFVDYGATCTNKNPMKSVWKILKQKVNNIKNQGKIHKIN